MLIKGTWKEAVFKPVNIDAGGLPPAGGALHPLLKVRSMFRETFLEMGFEEMQTQQFVESSFWNFDALYQPQQHPARDAHDTFFIKVRRAPRPTPHAPAPLPLPSPPLPPPPAPTPSVLPSGIAVLRRHPQRHSTSPKTTWSACARHMRWAARAWPTSSTPSLPAGGACAPPS